jgi:SAM-dependent methyltransferase
LTLRTDDTGYGEQYWASLDGGRGYQDSVMWADIGHIIHELIGVDKEAGKDNALSIRLLDVGCAFGYFLKHMRNRGYDVRGIDVSWYAVNNAPMDIKPYVGFHDLTKHDRLTAWFKPFDVITCFETLEHIAWDELDKAMGQVWEVLKPGGYFIATICVVGQPDTRSDPTHVSIVPREAWEERFASMGFEFEEQLCRQLRENWLFSQHKGVFVLRRPA